MKYETVGGSVHDTDHHKVTIRELKVGDKFKMKYNKTTYSVLGDKCIWQSSGQSVKKCLNLYAMAIEFKRCNTEVFKIQS